MIPSSPDASGFICSSDKFKNISNTSKYQQEGGERASIQGRKRREREGERRGAGRGGKNSRREGFSPLLSIPCSSSPSIVPRMYHGRQSYLCVDHLQCCFDLISFIPSSPIHSSLPLSLPPDPPIPSLSSPPYPLLSLHPLPLAGFKILSPALDL